MIIRQITHDTLPPDFMEVIRYYHLEHFCDFIMEETKDIENESRERLQQIVHKNLAITIHAKPLEHLEDSKPAPTYTYNILL